MDHPATQEFSNSTFKETIKTNPHFIPNQLELKLLVQSYDHYTLSYLYQRGLISWKDFIWALSLSQKVKPLEFRDQLNWQILDQLEELGVTASVGSVDDQRLNLSDPLKENINHTHLIISALLALTNDRSLAQDVLGRSGLQSLIRLKGKLIPALRLDENLYQQYVDYFYPLDWSILDSELINYLVQFSLNDFNQTTLSQLYELSTQDNYRFNLVFSRGLASVRIEQRQILDSREFLDLGFHLPFYQSGPTLTPKLYHFEYLIWSIQQLTQSRENTRSLIDRLELVIPDQSDQSVQHKLWHDQLDQLIDIGVTQANYPLVFYLGVFRQVMIYAKEHNLGSLHIFQFLSRKVGLPESRVNNFNLRGQYVYDYLNQDFLDRSAVFQRGLLFNKPYLIDLLAVNEDQRLFQLPQNSVPLQSFLNILTYNPSAQFCRRIYDHFKIRVDPLGPQSILQNNQFYSKADFLTQPHRLEYYQDGYNSRIWSLLSVLGSTYDQDYFYRRLVQRLYDQNQIGALTQLISNTKKEIFQPKTYYLDWVKQALGQDSPNFLPELKESLRSYHFKLETEDNLSNLPLLQWPIETVTLTQKIRTKIRDQAQRLSSLIREYSPYTADQIDLITTNFSRNQLILVYRNLSLPWRQNYIEYNRDQIVLALLIDLRAKFNDDPTQRWVIITTLNQLVDFINYVRDFDSLSSSELLIRYGRWLTEYQEVNPGQEVFLDPILFSRQEMYHGSLQIKPLYQLDYGEIQPVISMDNLISATSSSSPDLILNYLNQTPLSYLMARLLVDGRYDFYYYLLALIETQPHLQRRLRQGLFYFGILLITHQDDHFSNVYRSIFSSYAGENDPDLLQQYMDAFLTLEQEFRRGRISQNDTCEYINKIITDYLTTLRIDIQTNQIIQNRESLTFIDPQTIVTPEVVRLSGILSEPIFQVTYEGNRPQLEFTRRGVIQLQTMLINILKGSKPSFIQEMARVYNLVDYQKLEEVLPVFKILIHLRANRQLSDLAQQIPKETMEQWRQIFKQAFYYQYSLEQVEISDTSQVSEEKCFRSIRGLKETKLIQVANLVALSEILIDRYGFTKEDFLDLFYEFIQAMALQRNWTLLEVFCHQLKITDQDLLAPANHWIGPNPRTRAEVIIDLIAIYGQPDDRFQREQIESFYSLRGVSPQPNYKILDYIHYQRVDQVLAWYRQLEIPVQNQAEDFNFVIMLEFNRQAAEADRILNSIRSSVTNQDIFKLFTCQLDDILVTAVSEHIDEPDVSLYQKYEPYLTQPLNWSDPIYHPYLIKALINQKITHLEVFRRLFNFGFSQLVEALGPDFLKITLAKIPIRFSAGNNLFHTYFENQKLMSLLEILHRLGMRKVDLLEYEPDLLRLMAQGGLKNSLVLLHQLYGLNKEDLRNHNYPVLTYAAQYNDRLEIVQMLHQVYGLNYEDLMVRPDVLIESVIGTGKISILEIYHRDYGLTGDHLRQLGTDQIFEIVIVNQQPEVLKLLHDLYGLTRQDMDPEILIRAARSNQLGMLQILHDDYGFRLNDLRLELPSILLTIGQEGWVRQLEFLRRVYGLDYQELKETGDFMLLLNGAVNRGHNRLIKFLYDQMGFRARDFTQTQLQQFVLMALSNNHQQTADLLEELFGPI